jgi:hypothetical protein
MVRAKHPGTFPKGYKLCQRGYLDKSMDAYTPENSPREPKARADKFSFMVKVYSSFCS